MPGRSGQRRAIQDSSFMPGNAREIRATPGNSRQFIHAQQCPGDPGNAGQFKTVHSCPAMPGRSGQRRAIQDSSTPSNAREIRATPGHSRQLIIHSPAKPMPMHGLGRAMNDFLLRPPSSGRVRAIDRRR